VIVCHPQRAGMLYCGVMQRLDSHQQIRKLGIAGPAIPDMNEIAQRT